MDLKQLHQLKCELLKVYRYQGLTLQELLCEFYSHINEVINSTNGLIDIVDYLVGEGLSNEVATHLNQMLIDGTFNKIISNKVDELSTNLNNQFNEMKKIIESNISESNNLIENLKIYDSRFNNIDTKNIEQDTRLKDVENKNKVQDVYLSGLFNENKDGRLSVEGEGNSLKLEGSKSGLVEVDKVVGNTLVNLCNKDSSGNIVIGGSTRQGYSFVPSYTPLEELILECKCLNIEHDYILGIILVVIYKDSVNATDYFPFNNKTESNTNGTGVGQFYKNFTPKGDIQKINITLHGENSGTSIATIKDVKLYPKSMENSFNNVGSFTGLQSSFEENLVTQEMINEGLEDAENLGKYKVPIRLIGKNLFDKSKVKFVGIDTTNGLEVDNGYYSSDFIKIKPNTSYIRSQGSGIYYYDNDKKFILFQSHSVKSPTNAFYCRIQLQKDWNLDTVQIEEGTVATDYEDYFERTTNVYLNSPLLEGDEIVWKDGKLCHYHKCKKEIFNGRSQTDCSFYSVTSAIVLLKDVVYMENFIATQNLSKITWNGVSRFCLINTSITSLSHAQAYLQSNPVTVVYELAEPYYEPISSDKLLLECANDSSLHIDTVVPVESVKASYTSNVPSVYAIEETVIANLEDISVTQTAVDFLLMSNVGEVLVMSFMNNTKSGNNLGSYFANRIIKKALCYDDVINKYPQFKNDIDTILINEGYEYLIK